MILFVSILLYRLDLVKIFKNKILYYLNGYRTNSKRK